MCIRDRRTCSSHQGSTLGPLISVVAACVKDARPSRWLAPLERPRRPQHRPRVAPPAKPSLSAVELVELVGGEQTTGVGVLSGAQEAAAAKCRHLLKAKGGACSGPLRPFPCERAPPGLGLSCPQPDAERPANWVRFSAPRSWA